jgi:hypothetical protein
MRVVIPLLVLAAMAVAVFLDDLKPWLPTAVSFERDFTNADARARTEARTRAQADRPAQPTNAAAASAAAIATPVQPTRAASVPPPLKPATELPATLELVPMPSLPGAKPAAKGTISRAEAVASVIASREYQDTVTPIARLYHAAFNRFPDYEGINYYTGQREEARPLAEIADEFVGSREFTQLYGELTNAEFVERMFENVLGNASQADVRGYWEEALDSGRMTRGEVLVDLAESGAFRERSRDRVLVSTAYIEILRRTPDPDGYARWVAHLNAGNPYRSVIDGLLAGRGR